MDPKYACAEKVKATKHTTTSATNCIVIPIPKKIKETSKKE